MVKLILNGEEREIDPKKYKNFGELLDELQKEFKDRVLSKLVINGKEIPLVHIDQLRPAVIDEDNLTIELTFEPMKMFLINMLDDIIEYLDKVIGLLPKVSEDMIVDAEKGYNEIRDLSEGLSAIEDLRKNTEKLSNLSLADVGIKKEEQQEVVGILQNFVSSLENKDIIDLSDHIEENIPKVLEFYKNYFQKVKQILEENVN
ncbi:MAG: hypothetical protein J7L34_05425 [Thermotogaceae bacterium]|nr:hypothetical protein [Thermotogaceae bacterium]